MDKRWVAYQRIQEGFHPNKDEMLTEMLKDYNWRNLQSADNCSQIIRRVELFAKRKRALRFEAIRRNFGLLRQALSDLV